MGSGNVRWLLAELPGLVATGVLEPTVAERLRSHFAPQAGSRRRWVIVGLGVFGAALIGAGIAMLLAHNWEALSRPMRAGVALGLLLAAQGIAGFALWRRPDSVAWREGSAVGWVFATGAALGLISQTYHVVIHLGDFLALWTALALPIVWITRSRVATALAWCGAAPAAMIGLRSGAGTIDDAVLFWGFAALLLPTMALFARRLRDERLATLPFWVAALWVPIASVAQMESLGNRAWLVYFPALFVGLHALGRTLEPSTLAAWRHPLRIVGGLGAGGTLLILSFADVWSHSGSLFAGPTPTSWWMTVGVMVACGLLAIRQAFAAVQAREWATVVFLAAPFMIVALAASMTTFMSVEVAALACSAWLLVVGLLALVDGARRGRIGMANAGMACLAALAIARFFDADVTLVARGSGFLIVGIAFLAINVWLLRQRHGAEA